MVVEVRDPQGSLEITETERELEVLRYAKQVMSRRHVISTVNVL